jgi:hypothetical protein
MAYEFDNAAVRVASTGQVFYLEDDLGTIYPTVKAQLETPTTTIDSITGTPFNQLGLLSEDAVEHEFADETEDILSWQKGIVRTLITSRTASFTLAALETNRAALELFYGAIMSIPAAGIGRIGVQSNVARKKMITVLEFQDGTLADGTTPKIYRLIMPSSQVTELESPAFTSASAVTWGVTIAALGSSHDLLTLITNDPVVVGEGTTTLTSVIGGGEDLTTITALRESE